MNFFVNWLILGCVAHYERHHTSIFQHQTGYNTDNNLSKLTSIASFDNILIFRH
jgi:hypothetical protein